MPKLKKEPNEANVDSPCQSRLNSLGNIALDVIESILLDMIAPTIITEIEKNARNIEKNAQELAYLEALLRTHDANFQAHHAKLNISEAK